MNKSENSKKNRRGWYLLLHGIGKQQNDLGMLGYLIHSITMSVNINGQSPIDLCFEIKMF